MNCKCWDCSYCGPRKARRYKRAIREAAERHGLSRFLTLTLAPGTIRGNPTRYINGAFAKFRVYLRRQFKTSPLYIRILEFQQNGNPHFHVLLDRFISQQWIKRAWQAVGGGRFVDIRHVDLHRVSRYLSKYLTKELLLSAPKQSRRVTTSRGIKLLGKSPTDALWTVLRVPLSRLRDLFAPFVADEHFDEEGVLDSFTTNSICG